MVIFQNKGQKPEIQIYSGAPPNSEMCNNYAKNQAMELWPQPRTLFRMLSMTLVRDATEHLLLHFMFMQATN